MQVFRTKDKFQQWDGDDVEVELVQDPENGSSAPYHVQGTNGRSTNGGANGGVSRNESETLEGGPPEGIKPGWVMEFGDWRDGGFFETSWDRVRRHPKQAWAAAGGVAAMLLILVVLVLKLEFRSGHGGLTASPRSACTYSAMLLPPELIQPLEYNTTLHLEWGHFLTARGRDPPTTFAAESDARFKALRSTQCLVMHAQGLNFSNVEVQVNTDDRKCLCGSGDGCPSKPCTDVISPAKNVPQHWGTQGMVIVDIDGQINLGDELTLYTSYTGYLGTHNNGLYRSAMFVYGQEKSHLVSTQFKESYARQVLPCLDEPLYRAQHNLAAEVPPPMVALSNMPVASSVDTSNGLKMVTFETTPPMPTYLLALCTGRLKGKTVSSQHNRNITAWGPPSLEEIGEVDVALGVAQKAWDFYTTYTGVQLPLPKLDMVAVPGRSFAEPHWGLALFDERRFLFNQESEGTYDMWLAGNVVCHHLALQWFGGYVSPQSWAQLATADGTAGFLSYLCVEEALPQINGRALFQLATSPMGQRIGPHEGPQQQALLMDGNPLLPPLVPPDGLSPPPDLGCAKGAALWGMLDSYAEGVSPGGFQAGLQLYLQRHALSNGTMEDMVRAVAEALLTRGAQLHLPTPLCLPKCLQSRSAAEPTVISDFEIEDAVKLMTPYFSNPGYPLVFAESNSPEWGRVDFNQHRFEAWKPPSNAAPAVQAPPHWWAPLAVGEFIAAQVSGEPMVQYVELAQPSGTITLPQEDEALLSTRSWLIKRGGVGLFRANYDSAQLSALVKTLGQLTVKFDSGGAISPIDLGRLLDASALLDDAFAGTLSYNSFEWEGALRLAEAAAQSPASKTGFGQYLILLPVINGLQALRLRLRENQPCMDSFKKFQFRLLAEAASAALAPDSSKHGEQDAFLGALAQSRILTAAAFSGDTLVADTLCQLFANNTLHHHAGHLTGGVAIDQRGAAYMVAIGQPPGCQGDPERTLYVDERHWLYIDDEREDLRYLYAMPSSSNATDLAEVLRIVFGIQSTLPKRADPQDALQILKLVAANDVGGAVAWNFTLSNWPTLIYEQGWPMYRTLGELPLPSTSKQLAAVRAFFSPGGAGQATPQPIKDELLGRLASEVDWINAEELGLCSFLASEVDGR